MNIGIIKNRIEKLNESLKNIKEKIEVEKQTLRDEIINVLSKTHFARVRTTSGSIDYVYMSRVENKENSLSILGIKITNQGKQFSEGKLDIEYLTTFIDTCSSIEPTVFLGMAGRCITDWDGSPIRKDCSLYFTASQLLRKEPIGERAVAYCRESRQDGKYDRQMKMIKDRAAQDNCEIVEWFKEKISGTTSLKDRNAIIELIEYCNLHRITTIYVSELDRLGRKAAVIQQGITFLRTNGIKLIVAVRQDMSIDENYLIYKKREFNAYCKMAEEDKDTIVKRMHEGYNAYLDRRKNGESNLKLGRPADYRKPSEKYLEQYSHEIQLLKEGVSYRTIRTITGTCLGTIKKLNSMFVKR